MAATMLTLLVPKGGFRWAERVLQDPRDRDTGDIGNIGNIDKIRVVEVLDDALALVRLHAPNIKRGPVLFHVSPGPDGVSRATPLTEAATALAALAGSSSFHLLDRRFHLLHVLP